MINFTKLDPIKLLVCAAIINVVTASPVLLDRAKNCAREANRFCDASGTKDALQYLMPREISHLKGFMQALESPDKSPLSNGVIPPSPGAVDQYYNDSTGEGDDGEIGASSLP